MKLNTADFPRKAQFPLMIALGTLPAFVMVALQSAPASLPALAYLLPAHVLLAWLCMLLPSKARLPAGLLACAALMAAGLRLLPAMQGISLTGSIAVRIAQNAYTFLVPLALCFLLLYGLQFAAWPREQEIPFNWYAVGVGAHLLAQLIGYAERRQGSEAWTQAAPWLTAAFAVFLMLVLLSMNRSTMQSASLGRQRIPPTMRRRNVAITLTLLSGALLVAGVPAIVRFMERAWSLFIRVIGAVMAFIANLLETGDAPGTGGSGGGAEMMPAVEYQEPGLLAVLLEKIAMALALIAFLLLALFALRLLLRKAVSILRRIRAQLARYMTVASQDYVEEITDTREESGESSAPLLARIRRRIAVVSERSLTPAQRIRHRYRLLLRRHPDWHLSRTARENLPPDAAALYEAARYSGREVSEEEADEFKRVIGRNG